MIASNSTMPDLVTFFAIGAEKVDAKIRELIDAAAVEPDRLKDAICWSLFGGGKRFRPALVMAVGNALGADDESLLGTAAAVEMIHTYSLIHDDLPAMDDDDMRRGRATCHKKFDEAAAILAGDALQALAFHVVAEDAALPPEVRLRLVAELAGAAAKMVGGQQMDLDAEGKPLRIEDIERIHRGKTGALIRFSARAGAMIAGASEADLAAMSEFGSTLGLLFQVTDDLLDVTQTSEVLGKTAGKDAAAAKATYPNTLGLADARSLAARLHDDAVRQASSINGRCDLLIDLSRFIVARSS
jgi:geranylgeranyl pyrophosphate synthase